jgi:hypothetical protein
LAAEIEHQPTDRALVDAIVMREQIVPAPRRRACGGDLQRTAGDPRGHAGQRGEQLRLVRISALCCRIEQCDAYPHARTAHGARAGAPPITWDHHHGACEQLVERSWIEPARERSGDRRQFHEPDA